MRDPKEYPPPKADPGQLFTANPLQIVAAHVDVTLNGMAGDVLYAGGYAGSTNEYQINFRVPAGISAGMAKLQVVVAWVPGPEVMIAIQ
jgi:uncharacterized protein (TIGR03437 family)